MYEFETGGNLFKQKIPVEEFDNLFRSSCSPCKYNEPLHGRQRQCALGQG